MMAVNSVNGADGKKAGSLGMAMGMDSFSKNIQKQIANAQKELQELSSNDTMSVEEKMKKRQAIQQEIASLNQQLRQHQMEQRKERQSKGASMEDMLGGGNKKTNAPKAGGSKGSGFSQAGMQAMISADTSMKQANAQGSVAVRLEGQAGVAAGEIKQDAGRGLNTEKKEASLADLEEKVQTALESQASTLADGNKAMEEAKKAEQEESKSEIKQDTKGKEEKEEGGVSIGKPADAKTSAQSEPFGYVSVDILL